ADVQTLVFRIDGNELRQLADRCVHKYCPHFYPQNVRQSTDTYKRWKWRNFLISFIHSNITGFGSLFCCIYQPSLLVEVIDSYLEAAYILTSISHGYFIYDLIEMLTHMTYKGSKELVVHHILIISCFSLTVTQHKYCGYSSIALLIELSNIFLHFRQLLLISNTPKTAKLYRINCYTNFGMFIVVRGVCLIWLWATLLWVLPRVPFVAKTIAFVSLIGICTMTYVLFIRVYKSDFGNTGQQTDVSITEQLVGAQTPPTTPEQTNGFTATAKDNAIHSKHS
ncbi:unnamed protein product, partial [Oppiella nova]